MTAATRAELEVYCDEWFRAWTGGDPDRLLEHYAEDAVYEDPARPQGIRGHGELRRYFARLLPANPDMVWTRRELRPVEGGFVVSWTARIPVGGETLVERGMDLVLLRDGRIARNEVYFDRAAWLSKLAGR